MAKRRVTEVLLILEVEGLRTDGQVQAMLDAFRESVMPTEHGLTIYRATNSHAREFPLGGATRIVPPLHIFTPE